ncbi:type II toxin-antitoxin system PemK/MazF family toxin [Orrella sp. 11846]|uniref:type II toxin-antitoxin system PemK/MazF family toxin n=1 Tax=Orrella sp. 11846 TaxID=3409913 RepID=UPI003B5B9EF8
MVSPDRFNQATGLPVIVPITNRGSFVRKIRFSVPLSGTKTTGVIRCDQPRTLDLKDRNGRMIETVSTSILDEVLARVVTLFD